MTDAQTAPAKPVQAEPIPAPKRFESRHSGTFGGRKISYRAIAGETHIKDEAGKPRAAMFSTSYVAEDAGDPAKRPVTFVFNGGPGSSSMWLHMGMLGPKRVVVPSDARSAGAPPFPVVENVHCPLDSTDLVFIDPVGTGFSRPVGEGKAEEFWGLDVDARSIITFIRTWLTEHKRWNSPRYLAGESYGTTRAVALVERMHGDFQGLGVNGVLLISAIVDFLTARFDPGNIMPEIGYLPTYAASALYHGKVQASDRSRFLDEVRAFARTEYAAALLSGAQHDPARRREIAARMARYTGLSAEFIERCKLRIDPARFRKELLRDHGLTVGRFDTRYTGIDPDEAGDAPEADASSYAIDTAYVAAINAHLAELGVEMDRPYIGLNREALKKWDWLGKADNGGNFLRNWPMAVNVMPALARAQREQPGFRTFIANGYFDLATPFHSVEVSMTTNGVDPSRVVMTYYDGGHMMYVHEPSLDALAADVRSFYMG